LNQQGVAGSGPARGMPQQSMGMRVAEELAERTANERKEIARLRRWCQDVTRQCSYGKSQRERDEEERARRFAEQEAAREREKMDAHAILLERQRREAELHKGNKLDGVLTKLERQIERDRVKKGVKRPVFAPAVHAVLRRHMAASALCLPPEKAENPSTRWVHALEDSEEKYLTSLFRKQLHSKAKGKGKGKGKADDKDKAHDRSAQQHDHAAGAVTLQELKDLIRMSGGGEVALRDLRKLAADYISRIQWVRQSEHQDATFTLHVAAARLSSPPPSPRVPLSLSDACVSSKPRTRVVKNPPVSLLAESMRACESGCCAGRWDHAECFPGLHVLSSTA